jgi:hyperosmotically inducible protein
MVGKKTHHQSSTTLEERNIMKSKITAVCLMLGSLVVSVAATAQDGAQDRSHPMTFVKDSEITTKIKAKLSGDKVSSLVKVHVDTDAHGAVVLSGTVHSMEQEQRAVQLAKDTEGVTSVRNDLVIKKGD